MTGRLGSSQEQATSVMSLVQDIKSRLNEAMGEEYDRESAKLEAILTHMGLPLEAFSSEGRNILEAYARAADVLGVESPSPGALKAAWSSLILRESQALLLKEDLEQLRAELLRDRTIVKDKIDAVRATRAECQAKYPQQDREIEFYQDQQRKFIKREEQYKETIARVQKELETRGLTPELRHNALRDKSRQVQELQQKVEQMRAKLAEYDGLPASILGANMVLKKMKEKLVTVQKKLENGLAGL